MAIASAGGQCVCLALDVPVAQGPAPLLRGCLGMLILGSTSPRRAELLAQIGVEFTTLSPDIDETPRQNESPGDYVSRMSNEKFQSLIGGPDIAAGAVLLTADTVVVMDKQILGKPVDMADGVVMLERLSGEQHAVLSSVTIGTSTHDNRQVMVETIVKFRTLTTREIDAYWQTGEPKDKAGSYGIQGIGTLFVKEIKGSYTNVVGLPLTETAQVLAEFNVTTLG